MKKHWVIALIVSVLLLLTTSGTVLAAGTLGPFATKVAQETLEIDDSRVRPIPQAKQVRLMNVDLTGAAILTACGGVGLAYWYRAHHYRQA